MNRYAVLRLIASTWILACLSFAQLNLLTQAEAQGLVERLEDFRTAAERGQCPVSAVQPWGDSSFWITVRASCGDVAGQSCGVFLVDRRTGRTTLGESQSPLTTVASEEYLRTLLPSLALRLLSPEETDCLALAALRTIAEGDGASGFTVRRVREEADAVRIGYSYEERLDPADFGSSNYLSVSRDTGAVADSATGVAVDSAEVAEAVATMRELRLPPSLTLAEATQIVASLDPAKGKVGDPCWVLRIAEDKRSEEFAVFARPKCGNPWASAQLLAFVGKGTGVAKDPVTQTEIPSEEAKAIRERLLRHAAERRAQRQQALKRRCEESARLVRH